MRFNFDIFLTFANLFWRVMLKNSKGFKEISLDEKATWTTQLLKLFPFKQKNIQKTHLFIYSLENSAALG